MDHTTVQMGYTREQLISEACSVRRSLKGLPESEVADAVTEVIKCYAPFVSVEDLKRILEESGRTGQVLSD